MFWFHRLSLGLLLLHLAATHAGTLIKIETSGNEEEGENMELQHITMLSVLGGGGSRGWGGGVTC